MKKITTALISVYNKEGLIEFSEKLDSFGIKIISSGGTAKVLEEKGIPVTLISEITKFPEILGGRVKTLHPKISGGILMRRDNQKDLREAAENEIFPIDIVCVNLYPFKEVSRKPDAKLDLIIENIECILLLEMKVIVVVSDILVLSVPILTS